MDWQGQKLAEQLMQIMLLLSAAAAFLTGYVLASFQMMIIIYVSGVVLTAFMIIPNWPWFNRHPLNWLDSADAERYPKPQSAAVSSKKKSNKNK
ncbi:signal peptidase complex subunit 1-like [Silene latifolia]|uniref:signal peptidase complex subunit 1-like n=1 Tax=Silene latifolia TaxID=37657 RepID=UPI003D787D31